MGAIVRKLICWFTILGLSFLVEKLGWIEQGKAFFWIDLILLLIIVGVSTIVAVVERKSSVVKALISLVIVVGISILATWGVAELYNIDFYITYQIISLGKCFVMLEKKNKNR